MCGIIAYTGRDEAAPILLSALKSLEYRGYDSAGIAIFNGAPHVSITKAPGRVEELERKVATGNNTGTAGIGHTRWATHGVVNEVNAHPHASCGSDLALVHNGIVENYVELRNELQDSGHRFTSDTDSETIVHLIESRMKDGETLEDATRTTINAVAEEASESDWRMPKPSANANSPRRARVGPPKAASSSTSLRRISPANSSPAPCATYKPR